MDKICTTSSHCCLYFFDRIFEFQNQKICWTNIFFITDCFFKSNIKRVKLDQPSSFYFWSRTTLLFQDYAGDPGLRCWSRTTLLVQDYAAGPGLRCWSRTTLLVQDYTADPGQQFWLVITNLVKISLIKMVPKKTQKNA